MIGVLDSGVGGLAAARALADAFGSHDIVYFGDTARWPYGAKSPETIRSFAMKGAEFLMEKGAELLAVACHDMSAVALQTLAEKCSVEVVDAITPAAGKALEVSRFSRIGVIGSRTVSESGIYEQRIKSIMPEAIVYCVACPVLSVLAIEGWLKKPETNMIVKKCIHPLKVRQIDTLIAGAAEFSIISETIVRKAGKRISVVDPSAVFAGYLTEHCKENRFFNTIPEKKGRIRFFVSDLTSQVEIRARMFYGKNLVLEKVSV